MNSPSPTIVIGRWIDRSVMLSVRGYQRYLSPHKGYSCAHRVLHGGPSCSEYFRQSVGRYGSLRATLLLKQRLADCREARDELRKIRSAKVQSHRQQVGLNATNSPDQPNLPERTGPHKNPRRPDWKSEIVDCCVSPISQNCDCFSLPEWCCSGSEDGCDCGDFDCCGG